MPPVSKAKRHQQQNPVHAKAKQQMRNKSGLKYTADSLYTLRERNESNAFNCSRTMRLEDVAREERILGGLMIPSNFPQQLACGRFEYNDCRSVRPPRARLFSPLALIGSRMATRYWKSIGLPGSLYPLARSIFHRNDPRSTVGRNKC